jgi:hypothetical protein
MPKQCTAFSRIKPQNHPLDSTKTLKIESQLFGISTRRTGCG